MDLTESFAAIIMEAFLFAFWGFALISVVYAIRLS